MRSAVDSHYELDAKLVRAAFNDAAQNYDAYSLLQKTVAQRLIESFEYIKIKPTRVLDLGSGTGYGAQQLNHTFKTAQIYQIDLSTEMLNISRKKAPWLFSKNHFLCADAGQIPIAEKSIDLVFSNLMLQWCNDVDAVFAEIHRALKPGGVFLFTSFGPDTLKELRDSWRSVDSDIHVNAFADMHDMGDALVRNKMEAPVLSIEHSVLSYDNCKQLMRELKNIGAHNVNQGRRKTLTGKQRLQHVINRYESYRQNNKLPATYEVIYGHAWKPAQDKKNKNPGVHSVSLDDLKHDLEKRKSS